MSCIITYATRKSLAKYYIRALNIRDEESDSEPYQRGFKDGAGGIKLYYAIIGKMPNSQWILHNCMKKLDTRDKILATLTQEELDAFQSPPLHDASFS
tara:strand:+ start:584 stop:877 length:294 start_codon:yes stop_codon:yes gene_type:complete